MRRPPLIRPVAMLLGLAAFAVVAAGCGGGSGSAAAKSAPSPAASTTFGARPAQLTGGSTTLRLAATTRRVLDLAGIEIQPTGKATIRDGAFVFPITGGQLRTAPLGGRIRQAGGLRFSAAGRSVDATEMIVDPTSSVVTALVHGRRLPLMSLDVGRPSRVPPKGGAHVVIPAGASLIGSSALARIGDQLHVTALVRGLPVGRLVVSARLRTPVFSAGGCPPSTSPRTRPRSPSPPGPLRYRLPRP